jgi:sterol desaturase/sphingolipid hydroxylase (fatty acid hydroxylase superfamily)
MPVLSRPKWVEYFRLSRREYFADFFITPPLTIALTVISLLHCSWTWMPLFGAGLLAWTLYEYLMHRVGLHHVWFARDLHALHHDDQRDYIASHPLVTIAIYAVLWLLFGFNSSAFASGFSVGYVIYAALHTLFHYATILPGHPLFRLKRHHALHHKFDDANFGVSTRLWDRVFITHKE